jgi:F-type H+-transporting ATPase subunit epsilon
MSTFSLEIVTPEEAVFSGTVKSLTAPGSNGQFQILFNHAPFISTLSEGNMKVVTDAGETQTFRVQGGVVEVLHNKVSVLVERILN